MYLSDLLDRLGYKRDERGVHYTNNRRLLAKHAARPPVDAGRRAARRAGRRRPLGRLYRTADLLARLRYEENVRHLSPIEVFEQGLPDAVTVTITDVWYAGVRQPDGLPGVTTAFSQRRTTAGGRRRGGSRSPAVDALRVYVERCRAAGVSNHVRLTRQDLLRSGWSARPAGQAGWCDAESRPGCAACGRAAHTLTNRTPAHAPRRPRDPALDARQLALKRDPGINPLSLPSHLDYVCSAQMLVLNGRGAPKQPGVI